MLFIFGGGGGPLKHLEKKAKGISALVYPFSNQKADSDETRTGKIKEDEKKRYIKLSEVINV
jgi:hypothetical protein